MKKTPSSRGADTGRRDALKSIAAIAALPLVPNLGSAAPPQTASDARDRSFDGGWRFLRGDAAGAERPDFDDASWRAIDLPHDWSIEDLPPRLESTGEADLREPAALPTRVGPFDAVESEGKQSTGFVVGGIGWYRKRFPGSIVSAGQRAEIRFDGVYMDADVWLNGELLGNHPYGYTGFMFDATPHLRRDGENVVAVRVRNAGKNSRWYSGSGIYRHVWLTVTGDLRVATWGVGVTTPKVAVDSATARVVTTVENHAGASRKIGVRARVVDPSGAALGPETASVEVPANGSRDAAIEIALPNPKLWSAETPALYRAEVELVDGANVLDRYATTFGVRTIEVDAERGLRINGKVVKLKGGCLHHDNGVLGAAAIDRAEERRVELMKANGFDAIRTSHNPPSPAFLEACDRLGVYVVDEAFDMWRHPKNPEDYHRFFDAWWQRDVQSMVLRDRNHPSVVFWSIGNEIHERADPDGVEIAERLVGEIKRLDPTRPVTAAICHFWDYPNRPWVETDAAFVHLDVGGYNYKWQEYENDHARHPKRVMMGTESFPKEVFENWDLVEKHPYVVGDFVWTGMDYLGEVGIGHVHVDRETSYELQPYPWFNAWCGDVDLIGQKKPQMYFRDVVWRTSPIAMAVQRPVHEGHKETVSAWGWSDELRSWTWPGHEGKQLAVRVYTRGDTVRLTLDGKEVGTARVSAATKLTAEFSVPYAPGTLRAVATENGKEIGAIELATTGAPAKLRLTADRAQIRASRDDLVYVTAEVLDAKGNLVADAVVPVTFALTGAAEIAGIGSANPRDAASFRAPRRKSFHGRCLAVLRPLGARGEATLRATADGLEPASVTVRIG